MISTVEIQRKRVGLTQTELSNKAGISRRALSSIEKSTSIPSVDIALKLATILNTTVEDLFRVSDTTVTPEIVVATPIIPIQSSNNKWNTFKFIDLFAGIGGIRLGFESVGGQCVFSSEFDEDACKTYEANFGEHPSGDITKINAEDIPDFDILLGGFPCQAFSIIGKKEGFANETCGTLFFDIERILKVKRPSAFMLENVRNLVAHDNGNTFKVIREHLKALGYTVHAKVLNALDYGVPQKRERIIIVGFLKDIPFEFPKPVCESERLSLSDILEENVDTRYYVKEPIKLSRLERLRDKDYPKPYISHENMAGSVTPHPYSSALRAGASANYILVNDERRPTEREMLRIQGFPDTFKIVLPYGKIKKQCGNSVAIPVIKAVAEEMLKSLRTYDC
ncbi:MAG: DNA (cytosine-5-)-methyltransferase [Clostridia bacterium]|nr:DNA (cytosine-5-)-methyltransferase [Clostridia bacterium]